MNVDRIPSPGCVQLHRHGMRRALVASACCGMILSLTGCQQLAGFIAAASGGDYIEPQFKLTKGPLLIFIDDIDTLVTEPRALRELHDTLSANFLEFKVNNRVVPFEEWQRLKQTDPTYDDLKIRQIGDKLGAEQILYLRVTRFALQSEPGADVYQGDYAVNVKVLSTEQKRDVRLWPREELGRRISVKTQPEPIDGDRTAIDIANEVAIRLGQEVARLFYGHRSMDR